MTASEPIGLREAWTDQMPQEDHSLHWHADGRRRPGSHWTADPKHVDLLTQWSMKRCGKPAPTLGTKASGHGLRCSLDSLSAARGGKSGWLTGIYFLNRPDMVYPSKTAGLDIYIGSCAGRGMCRRVGVVKVRHIELRYLWCQERPTRSGCTKRRRRF